MKPLFSLLLCFGLFSSVSAQTFELYNDENLNDFLFTNVVYDLDIDQDGNVWVSSAIFGLGKFDGARYTSYSRLLDDEISDFVHDVKIGPNNNVWVATSKGLVKMSTDGKIISIYDTTNTDIPGEYCYAISFAPDGTLWLSSRKGSFDDQPPVSFDGNIWTLHDGIPKNNIHKEIYDYAFDGDVVWMGNQNGLLKYENGSYTGYYKAQAGIWESRGVEMGPDKTPWFAGNWALVNYKNGEWQANEYADLDDSMESIYTNCLKIQGNYAWIGTNSSGLFRVNLETKEVKRWTTENSDIPSNSVIDFAIDKQQNLWMASSHGLMVMKDPAGVDSRKASFSFEAYPNPFNDVLNIHVDPSLTANTTIELQDMQGRKLVESTRRSSDNWQLNTSLLKPGSYLLVVSSNKERAVKHIVKE